MICFGVDEIILQNPAWKTKSIGLVTNDAATTNTGILSRAALVQAGFNIVCLFTLPFWLGSSFFTDQISRFLLSIAALSYFFLQPYLKSRKLLVSANFFLALILNVVMARRAESFFFVGILILTYIDNFKINPGRNVFYITLTLISLFFSVKYFQFGTTLISRYEEGHARSKFFLLFLLIS